MKKVTALFLLGILCMSCLSVLAAPTLSPTATLSVSERDENGNLTLTLTVAGVYYQGVQASVYFNPAELTVTDEIVKSITVGESVGNKNSLNLVQAELHEENNCIAVTAIMDLSLMDEEIYYLSSLEKEMTVFSLTVPSTVDKPDVGFALRESPVYDKGNPDGLVISYNGESQEAQTRVLYADGTMGQTGEIKKPAPQKTAEELRAERIKDTVIIQLDNYAAVKNGALCYVDENNKAVMPFVQDGEIYVPYRFVAESFDMAVYWDADVRQPYWKHPKLQPLYVGEFILREDRSFIRLSDLDWALNLHGTVVGNCVVVTTWNNPWNTDGGIEQGILSDAMLIMSPAIRDMK